MLVTHPVSYIPLSASGVVKASPGDFYGIVVVASTTAILQVWDNASAGSGVPLYASVTALTAGQVITFNGIAIKAKNGLFLTLVSGTGTFNVLFD